MQRGSQKWRRSLFSYANKLNQILRGTDYEKTNQLQIQYGYCLRGVRFSVGTVIAINTIAVNNEVADNIYQRSELDYLIYNNPIAYALTLNGDPKKYLKEVTEYKPLD